MRIARIVSAAAAATLIAVPLTACSDDSSNSSSAPASASASADSSSPEQTPSQVLSAHPWETTAAVDQEGKELPLTDVNVETYVGFAYFNADGTFQMYTLQDQPKMQGDWTVSDDGKTRHIVAKNDDGTVRFERDSEITELTDSTFTYRTYPEQDNKSVYIDIVHTPTDHAQPQQ